MGLFKLIQCHILNGKLKITGELILRIDSYDCMETGIIEGWL